MNKTLVFVYGTLKKGQCRGGTMEAGKFIGPGKSQTGDLVLLTCGPYPAIAKPTALTFETKPMVVEGEVYEVDALLLKRLDAIEGYPYLYTREEITLQDGTKAISYFISQTKKFTAKAVIESGVWDDSMARR